MCTAFIGLDSSLLSFGPALALRNPIDLRAVVNSTVKSGSKAYKTSDSVERQMRPDLGSGWISRQG